MRASSRLARLGLVVVALALGAWHAPKVGPGPGPGFQYPIIWVYHRLDLPVEVTGEFNVWRHVVAPDGGDGWVHEALLHGLRSFIVIGGRHTLRAGPHKDAAPVAYLDKGVIGVIRRCKAGAAWCQVEVDHRAGWLRRDQFWGSFAGEAIK